MNILKEFELSNKIHLCNRPLPGFPFTSGLNNNRKWILDKPNPVCRRLIWLKKMVDNMIYLLAFYFENHFYDIHHVAYDFYLNFDRK